MGLFTTRPDTRRPRPVIALTGRDIDQITTVVRSMSSTARIEALAGTLQVRDLMARMIGQRLATSGYVISAPDPYAVTVTGWRPTPGQDLAVEDLDARIAHLQALRDQATAAARPTAALEA